MSHSQYHDRGHDHGCGCAREHDRAHEIGKGPQCLKEGLANPQLLLHVDLKLEASDEAF